MTQLLTAIHAPALEEQARSMAAVILRRLFAAEFQEFYTVVSVAPPVARRLIDECTTRCLRTEC